MAVCPGLTQLLVLTVPSKNTHSVTFLLRSHSPLRRWQSGVSGWRCSDWRSLIYPSIQPCQINLGQILGCATQILLFLHIQDLKESWRFGGYKPLGIFEIPSPFLFGCLTAGAAEARSPVLSTFRALSSTRWIKWQSFSWLQLSNMRFLLTSSQLGLELILVPHRC